MDDRQYFKQNRYVQQVQQSTQQKIQQQLLKTTMDIFEFPDDYKPQRPLTDQEAEDITQYLKSHPLFMKEIPENIQSNEHLVALQHLVEDDPVEDAQALNREANQKLKAAGSTNKAFMRDAYNKYTQAIKIKCPSAKTNAKLHANRAALNMKLRNYGKVVQDCKMCLKFDPEYLKGYYRYGKALIALKKFEECLELLKERKEPELKEIIEEAKNKLSEKNKKVEEQKKEQQSEIAEIRDYFKVKNWRYAKRQEPLPEGAQLKIVNKQMSIPLVILYPQFKQFDLIAGSLEKQKLWPQLSEMISPGLPWDTKKQYSMDSIEVYCELAEGILMRIPKQVNIGDVASKVIIKQAMEFIIVCKNNEFYNFYMPQHKII